MPSRSQEVKNEAIKAIRSRQNAQQVCFARKPRYTEEEECQSRAARARRLLPDAYYKQCCQDPAGMKTSVCLWFSSKNK